MIGAGFMGRGVARQIIRYTPGMELAAVVQPHLGRCASAPTARPAWIDVARSPTPRPK